MSDRLQEIKARCEAATKQLRYNECECDRTNNGCQFRKSQSEAASLIDTMLSQLAYLQAENAALRAYRTPQKADPGEDRPSCPRCREEIVGYYASYCEYCGQAVDTSDDDEEPLSAAPDGQKGV